MSVGTNLLEQIRHSIEVENETPAGTRPLMATHHSENGEVQAEVTAYDSLGLTIRALTVLGDNRQTFLEDLARSISQRLTYLWEPLALIERDPERGQAQLRSSPPFVEDDKITYFEGQLARHNGTSEFQLTRYTHTAGEPRRTRVPITLTHDVFRRLIDDLSAILQAESSE